MLIKRLDSNRYNLSLYFYKYTEVEVKRGRERVKCIAWTTVFHLKPSLYGSAATFCGKWWRFFFFVKCVQHENFLSFPFVLLHFVHSYDTILKFMHGWLSNKNKGIRHEVKLKWKEYFSNRFHFLCWSNCGCLWIGLSKLDCLYL